MDGRAIRTRKSADKGSDREDLHHREGRGRKQMLLATTYVSLSRHRLASHSIAPSPMILIVITKSVSASASLIPQSPLIQPDVSSLSNHQHPCLVKFDGKRDKLRNCDFRLFPTRPNSRT